MAEAKKYFWLRLKRDFFKRHDIKILRRMEHGDEMVVFYLALLTESIDHEGALRFSEDTPYTTQMLAYVTDTDEEIAEKAMTILTSLGMVKVGEDGTFFMPELKGLISYETDYARQKREWREEKRQCQDNVQTMSDECPDNVETMSDKSKSKSKSKRKSKNVEKNVEEKNPYGEFSHVLLTDTEYSKLSQRFGEQKTTEYIVKLDRYIETYPSKGSKYRSHYATILTWIEKDIKEAETKNPYEIDWDEVRRKAAEMAEGGSA